MWRVFIHRLTNLIRQFIVKLIENEFILRKYYLKVKILILKLLCD